MERGDQRSVEREFRFQVKEREKNKKQLKKATRGAVVGYVRLECRVRERRMFLISLFSFSPPMTSGLKNVSEELNCCALWHINDT